MKFAYEGFTALGEAKKDVIEAKDQGEAAKLLREKGIFAQNIAAEADGALKTVLPGNDKKKADMVMPWQDPAEESQIIDTQKESKAKARYQIIDTQKESKAKARYDAHRALQEPLPAEPAKTLTIILPTKEWKRRLKAHLDAIDEVVEQFEKLRPPKKHPTITAAKKAAVEELVKQAIMKAVADAI